MSGPYRFNQESAKSPLDRTSSPFSAGQPVSFKTNVNRMKTKKWVTAKKNAYDGDDWGEYDEYDEYGVDQEPQPSEPPASQRYYAGPQRINTDRSFTDPSQQGPPGKARRNSFEAGEEHRAFSASIPQPQPGYGEDPYGAPQRQASGADSDIGHDPQGRRDFSPSAMPPPLQTRVSPLPMDAHASPSTMQYPPRKSSIGQAESPLATSPRSATRGSADKPLPFIRPADIYRRVEEERERERASLDSSRPSLDSLTGRPKDELQSPIAEVGKTLQPLETVPERKSEYLPDFNAALPPNNSQKPITSQAPAVSPNNDQAFRSVVDQAFTRSDDQRSIPPTPISKDSETDMSRSNTGSTIGISPIMSRVPSSATSAVKRSQAGGEGSTPVIAEEPSTAVTQPTPESAHTTALPAAPKPLIDHQRNISNSSLPRSGLATPTRGDSPARSALISPQKEVPELTAAQVSAARFDQADAMEGGLSGPSAAYATRESDIASAVKGNAGNIAVEGGAAEKYSQDAFLESHNAQSSIDEAHARSRSESPSKGRVQALAGKFGDISTSRRGSTQSNASRHSVQSWERSHDNSRAPSPTKGSPGKPSSPVKEFRPHLPGQWESYATTAATPSDQADKERMLGFDNMHKTTSPEDVELTPTTAKHPVAEVEPKDTSDPLAALKNAGNAMAQSFRATVGLDNNTAESTDAPDLQTKSKTHGDVYMPRPLQLDRTISSNSSIPPTPPAKDSPTKEYPPPPPLKELSKTAPIQTYQRPELLPQLSSAPSAEDEESDRLRKEIVASLSPVRSLEIPAGDHDRSSLQPTGSEAHRVSSVLPAEYDSYWADGGHVSPRPSQDTERNASVTPTAPAVPSTPPSAQPPQPSLLNRFSWEANSPHLMTPDGASKDVTPEPTKSLPDNRTFPPAAELTAEEKHQQRSEALPDTYVGSGQSITVTKPDPTTEPDQVARSPTSPVDHGSLSSPTREQTRSPGLHVVNSAVNPEAVDLPPRLSADFASPTHTTQDGFRSAQPEADRALPNPAVSATVPATEPNVTSPTQAHMATSPTTDKPLGAREIATINSTSERISTYNKTRDHWATHDHGLEGWLTSALEANPDLASQTSSIQRTTTGAARHKHTASLSLLGKLGGSGVHHSPGSEQNNSASSQLPVSGGSPTAAGPSGSGTGFDRRVASAQMQMKGKDLLHTAGALSGKGLTSAKGLFAKGKSRFGREKGSQSRPDSVPSSREASEEPEFVPMTTPERSWTQFSTDTDSPREEKKKRRFSISSFHRSSRSRSRPTSIVLPSNTSQFSSTPKGTPPREVSRILGEQGNRPHSFHAPDSWNFVPGSQAPGSSNRTQSTPPRQNSQQQQSRLGILPSPAKSAFSANEQGTDQDAPPVPPIPDNIRLSNDLSHEVLQSVIRYSTPPVTASKDTQGFEVGPFIQGGQRSRDIFMPLADENITDTQGALQQFRLGLGKDSPDGLEKLNTGTQLMSGEPKDIVNDRAVDLQLESQPGLAVSTIDDSSQQLHSTEKSSESQERKNWETQIIGAGDVSPISSDSEDDESTPRNDRSNLVTSPTPVWYTKNGLKLPKTRVHPAENSRDTLTQESQSDEAVPSLQPEASPAQGTLQPAPPASADEHHDHPTRRVSAAPLQVVHAVEEYAASDSSFASWDHESNARNSVSATSQLGDMRDESDLVTPVAQVPSIVQHDKAEPFNDNSNKPVMRNGYFGANGNPSNTLHHARQPSSDLSVPERSKSMLSMISSMVSEGGTPISPASSNAGRSTPSTIRRMQHEPSVRHGPNPAQIPEESSMFRDDRTPTAQDDDFELYADHDGVVKDVRDESGQPLRLAQEEQNKSTERAVSNEPRSAIRPSGPDMSREDGARHSTERPMSFISGPPDQDGKPQDQINQLAKQNAAAAQLPPMQLSSQMNQSAPASNGTVYSTAPPDRTAPPAGFVESSNSGTPVVNNTKPLPPSNNGHPEHASADSTAVGPRLPPNSIAMHVPVSHANEIRGPQANGPLPPNSQFANATGQHDQMYGGPQRQAVPHNYPVQGQRVMPDHDPRFPGQPNGPTSGPRNEYEFQQQMMQLQAKFPRPQGAQGPVGSGPMSTPPMPGYPPVKPQDKPSAKPRLSSVATALRGLGGKLHGTSQQASQPHNAAAPSMQTMPVGPNNSNTYQPGVTDVPREQLASRPGERPGSALPPQRPPSNGAESHFSQVSHGSSTRVQPTDSRQDLRKPVSPAPYQGIPPQQMPARGSAQATPQAPYRATTSGMPEPGKKKRFSTLGNFFGQSSKAKPAKEDKKAQKAQRHATAPPMQAPTAQYPPQQQMYRPQQPGMAYPPGQYAQQPGPGMPPMGPQFASPQTMSPATPQGMPPHMLPQHYQSVQQRLPSQEQIRVGPPEEGSAYLRTKQLAQEHQIRQVSGHSVHQQPFAPQPNPQAPNTSFGQHPLQPRQPSQETYGPPPGGYYNPNQASTMPGQPVYKTQEAGRPLASQQIAPTGPLPGPYRAPQIDQQQPQHQSQHAETLQRPQHTDRLQSEQSRPHPSLGQASHGSAQVDYQQIHQQHSQAQREPQRSTSGLPYDRPMQQQQQHQHQQPIGAVSGVPTQNIHQQSSQPQQNYGTERNVHGPPQAEMHRLQQERLQQAQPGQQVPQPHLQQPGDRPQYAPNPRSVSGPVVNQAPLPQHPPSQRHVSSPTAEPQYETPQIPAAYSHVSGAFISPRDREQQPLFSPHQEAVARLPPVDYNRQNSDPRMPTISPQVSAQSQMPANQRTHSDASIVSAVSISPPEIRDSSPPPNSSAQKTKMNTISEVHQGAAERPWHLNFPEGATEQEIVRARQRQYMEEQFTAQQQMHAERAAKSPSPRVSSHSESPVAHPVGYEPRKQGGGGFKELLPRSSPQPYPQPMAGQTPQQGSDGARSSHELRPAQPLPIHPDQPVHPAAYPLPMSPDPADASSPANPLAAALAPPPPPKLPHSPMHPPVSEANTPSSQEQRRIAEDRERYEPSPPQDVHNPPPQNHSQQYDHQVPDEPPPSYDGPGMPTDGMDKSRAERNRPPNIVTDTHTVVSNLPVETRQRQPSIGLMQHPQPASMAASPQRSSADMGAESLRRQLLQQEEYARMERIQRSQMQQAESERERQEREAARARARELERSVSGGGRVGSIRSVGGSRNGGAPGWERRGSTSRPVFELPAVEDDEPAMRATSYPGQEWVPPSWIDD